MADLLGTDGERYRAVDPDAPDVALGQADASVLGVDEEQTLGEEGDFPCSG